MFEIPEDEAHLLLCGAKLPEFDDKGSPTQIPDKLYQAYMRFKRVRDRFDMSALSTDAMAFILVLAGYGDPEPETPPSVAALYRQGILKHGDKVFVRWQNKDREAKIIGNTGDDDEVIVDLEGTERRVATERVKQAV